MGSSDTSGTGGPPAGVQQAIGTTQQAKLDSCIFIDDVTLAATGSRDSVLRSIGRATEQLTTSLAPMGCTTAPNKTAVVGSDTETARGLRRVVGAEHFNEQGQWATVLGADFAAGRRRQQWQKHSQTTKRIKAAKMRRGRVNRLRLAGE